MMYLTRTAFMLRRYSSVSLNSLLQRKSKNITQSQSKVTLPNIAICKFIPKGKTMYSDLQVFRSSFETIFINNELYTPFELYNYPASFLGGDARDVCTRYYITQDFAGAYKELITCYDRSQLLIQGSIDNLNTLERPNSNFSSLRILYVKQNQSVS